MEKEANWPGPEGLIPALEKNAANASLHTRRFLDEILIEERIIGTCVADLTMKLWGSEFTSPIMMPAFSHLNKAGLDHRPMEEYAQAAKNLGIVNWVGMESDADYAKIAEVGSKQDAQHDAELGDGVYDLFFPVCFCVAPVFFLGKPHHETHAGSSG